MWWDELTHRKAYRKCLQTIQKENLKHTKHTLKKKSLCPKEIKYFSSNLLMCVSVFTSPMNLVRLDPKIPGYLLIHIHCSLSVSDNNYLYYLLHFFFVCCCSQPASVCKIQGSNSRGMLNITRNDWVHVSLLKGCQRQIKMSDDMTNLACQICVWNLAYHSVTTDMKNHSDALSTWSDLNAIIDVWAGVHI